jgi:hypothetical protein
MNSNDIQQGMQDFQNNVNQGTDVLKQGQAGSNAAFSPYTTAGATGASGMEAAIQGRTQAPNAAVTDNSAGNAIANYLDPSSAYSIDQANKEIQAEGIAGGAVGGGMEKALSNNANQMAQTNYNNAYSQMLAGNNLTNTQQNTNAQNTNNFTQQQVGNFGQLAGLGLNATSSNQGLQAGYNSGINSNFGDIAVDQQSGYNALGKNANNTATNAGNSAGGILSTF